MEDRADLDDVLGRAFRGIARELRERPLGLAYAREDLPLENDLGLRGRLHGHGDSGDDLAWVAKESARHLVLVHVDGHLRQSRPEMKERVRADHDGHRDRLATLLRPALVVPEVTAAVQALSLIHIS